MSNSVCKKFLDVLVKLGLYKRPFIRWCPPIIKKDKVEDDET